MSQIHEEKKLVVSPDSRRLYEYFMLSESEANYIERLYKFLSLEEGKEGISIQSILKYLQLESNSFYESFFNHLIDNTHSINFDIFNKFLLITIFTSTDFLISNCFRFFSSLSRISRIDPFTMLLDLFNLDEISEQSRLEVFELYEKQFESDFIRFLTDSKYKMQTNKLFDKFHLLSSKVKSHMMPQYMRKNIIHRIDNYEYFYSYYVKNRQYPPLSLCDHLYSKFTNTVNPNIFDYYMDPNKRSQFPLPTIFTKCSRKLLCQIQLNNRNSTAFSGSNDNFSKSIISGSRAISSSNRSNNFLNSRVNSHTNTTNTTNTNTNCTPTPTYSDTNIPCNQSTNGSSPKMGHINVISLKPSVSSSNKFPNMTKINCRKISACKKSRIILTNID